MLMILRRFLAARNRSPTQSARSIMARSHDPRSQADESWAHHLRHGRIAAQLRIQAGMGDDDGPGRNLERGFRGLHIGTGEIDKDAQPIALLDDGCAEWGQSAIARRVGINGLGGTALACLSVGICPTTFTRFGTIVPSAKWPENAKSLQKRSIWPARG
jgi:hypothetical protein